MGRLTFLFFIINTLIFPLLSCDWLQQYGHLSNKSLFLIKAMGGQLTKQEIPVSFPNNLYRRIHNAEVDTQLAFMRDSLRFIKRLWLHLCDYDNQHHQPSSVTCDTTETEHFLFIIVRQQHELKRCGSKTRRVNGVLRRHYRTLERRTLSPQGNGTESWELIRRQTELHLEQLHMLLASVTKRCPASGTLCH